MSHRLLVCLLLSLLPGTAPRAQPADQAPPQAATVPAVRPRIGLVLSGGGARGLAHVGVLKVLEREHVPVDVIAGTSMGAIIGGLYASGMPAAQIEAELKEVDWNRLFAPRVQRQQLSQRRKEEDFELATVVEMGYRDGQFRAPQGAVSTRGLESLLRRYTLPVRDIAHFDDLPIPFRAVATDMETGEAVVIRNGDLAMALRSSMSVPAVFPPTEVNGRVLGDGGLVNNVPVDVARAMGADRLIVVNIGTPLAGRDTLNSALGLTAQMINILTEQNVQRSLASLQDDDVLLVPRLDGLTSGDFNRAPELILAGEQGAERWVARLRTLAIPAQAYADWQRQGQAPRSAPPVLRFIRYEGTSTTNPSRLEPQLQSRVGQVFDRQRAESDILYLAASGDYVRTDYRLLHTPDGDGLLFDLEDKPWGPDYLNIGLDLSTDFQGQSAFNLKLSHNRHWLTPSGTEWRNRLQIGEVPQVATELYHPLTWTLGLWNDWFVSGLAEAERRSRSVFAGNGGDKLGEFRRTSVATGVDLGQPWGNLGEVRFGLTHRAAHTDPQQHVASAPGLDQAITWQEAGLRARLVMDQLDYANFPQRGYRIEAEAMSGIRKTALREHLAHLEAQFTAARSWGRQTVNLQLSMGASTESDATRPGRYSLGGFQQLSGYQAGQISGNGMVFGRLGWYLRLADTPLLARGIFVGASMEAGNAWNNAQDLRLSGLRQGASLFVGLDSGIGPMYFGLTLAPRGEPGLMLFIGRP